MSDSLWPHELQHARPPCPSQTPGVYSNSCPSSQWCHPAISSSVIPFSSCPQSLPASGSFPTSQLFAWGGQSIGALASASVLLMNTQDLSSLGWTGWLSLQSKGLSKSLLQHHRSKASIFQQFSEVQIRDMIVSVLINFALKKNCVSEANGHIVLQWKTQFKALNLNNLLKTFPIFPRSIL